MLASTTIIFILSKFFNIRPLPYKSLVLRTVTLIFNQFLHVTFSHAFAVSFVQDTPWFCGLILMHLFYIRLVVLSSDASRPLHIIINNRGCKFFFSLRLYDTWKLRKFLLGIRKTLRMLGRHDVLHFCSWSKLYVEETRNWRFQRRWVGSVDITTNFFRNVGILRQWGSYLKHRSFVRVSPPYLDRGRFL